jgi:hypothetical protein
MDFTTIAAAMASAKALKELLQAATSLKIDNETLVRINQALNEVSEIQEKLFEAREQLFSLQKANDDLRQQIRAHDDWKERLGQFALTKTVGGAVVYESRIDKPKHYVCPQCTEKQQVQILQDLNVAGGAFQCPGCKTLYPINERHMGRPS